MDIKKVYIIMPLIFILGGLVVFLFYELRKWRQELREKDREEDLPGFLIEWGLKQFDLRSEKSLGERRFKVWKDLWDKQKVPHDIFKSFYIILPTYFANSLLGKNHWILLITDSSYTEGWFDIILRRRHHDDVSIRLHYLDIVRFNEGCNKVIGRDMTVLTSLLQEATLVAVAARKVKESEQVKQEE